MTTHRTLLALVAVCASSIGLSDCTSPRPATSPATSQANPDDVTRLVRARLDSLQAHTTFYARDLGTGREIAVRADEPMNTASVIKIPVMILAFRDADAGRLDLTERYTVLAEDVRGGTGLLQTFAAGLQPTVLDLITQMVITSDNTATDIMIRVAIGHKTGDWPPYVADDVGIMYPRSEPIVLAVFSNSNRGPFFDLEATEGRIAEDVLNAWSR